VKVLLTGHRGFLGQHLVRELKDHGHRIHGVDVTQGPQFDLTRPGVFECELKAVNPDVVVHLAAQTGRVFGEIDVEYTIRENALMCALVGKASAAHGIPVFYASTSEVYGDRGELDCDEDTLPVLPHNLYGLAKRWGEEALALYAPHGLQVARLSMPYGPGAPPGVGRRALDNILHQALYRRPIVVHRDAERSWCWVGDLVRGLRLIMESRQSGTWNVGREDDRRSMEEIAQRACTLTDAPEELITLVDAPHNQTLVKRLNCDRFRKEFDWTPTVEIDEGMSLTLDWVRRYDENCEWIA
jgi:nucleoside-diphosphate-sugar epimerase